jgi:hypothetical protein
MALRKGGEYVVLGVLDGVTVDVGNDHPPDDDSRDGA